MVLTIQTSLYSLGASKLTPARLPSGPSLCPTSGKTVNKSSFLSGACCLQGIYRLLLAPLRHLFSQFKFSSLCLPPRLICWSAWVSSASFVLPVFVPHLLSCVEQEQSLHAGFSEALYNFLLHTQASSAVLSAHFPLSPAAASTFTFSKSVPFCRTGNHSGQAANRATAQAFPILSSRSTLALEKFWV